MSFFKSISVMITLLFKLNILIDIIRQDTALIFQSGTKLHSCTVQFHLFLFLYIYLFTQIGVI